MVVSWRVSRQITADLTLDALVQSLWARKVKGGLIDHSDRGSLYLSIRYTERLVKLVSKHQSETSATHTIMHWRRGSMGYSKQKSSTAVVPAKVLNPLSMLPLNGWICLTTSECLNQLATFRQLNSKKHIILGRIVRP